MFYLFSVIVLVMRMCLYVYILQFYSEMEDHIEEFEKNPFSLLTMKLNDLVSTARYLGNFYVAADYSKSALGFI